MAPEPCCISAFSDSWHITCPLQRVLSFQGGSLFLRLYATQLFSDVAVVQQGALMSQQHFSPTSLQCHKLPHNLAVTPLCVVGGSDVTLQLTGSSISGPEAAVLLKCGGEYLTPAAAAGSSGM